MNQDEESIKAALLAKLKEAGYEYLTRNGADYAYDNLAGICKVEGKELTVKNLMLYAPMMESDLSSMFS